MVVVGGLQRRSCDDFDSGIRLRGAGGYRLPAELAGSRRYAVRIPCRRLGLNELARLALNRLRYELV